MENVFFSTAVSATVGALVGGALVIWRVILRPNEKFIQWKQRRHAFQAKFNPLLVSLTILVLCVGLIWTIYYLLLGLTDPAQTEYATNVSQLIVSVLTVFSIIIAFYQFAREKPGQ